MSEAGARFQYSSDQSLLVSFDSPTQSGRAQAQPLQNPITLQANEKVRKLLRLLELERVVGVRDLHPAYCSLLVKFDALKFSHDEVEGILRGFLARLDEVKLPEPHLVEIPVCYGGEFGPDLVEVATLREMTGVRGDQQQSSLAYLA